MILSTHGVIASQIPSFVGLLDTYPNAAVAYSVRKLRAAYTGSAIRVRRSSDNTEQNIGFDSNGNLDESALTTFVGANNGFVVTWFDQSTNGNNATMSTAANQPQIVSSGTVLKLTGIGSARPILRFDGTNDHLRFTNLSGTGPFTSFHPTKKFDSLSIGAWFTTGDSAKTPYSPVIYGASGTYIGSNTKSDSITFNSVNYLLLGGIAYGNSTTGKIYVNNTLQSGYANNADLGTGNFNSINARVINNEYSKCDVPEMILYLSDQQTNVSNINANINTYYAIY
jgi:hypothetical protein